MENKWELDAFLTNYIICNWFVSQMRELMAEPSWKHVKYTVYLGQFNILQKKHIQAISYQIHVKECECEITLPEAWRTQGPISI